MNSNFKNFNVLKSIINYFNKTFNFSNNFVKKHTRKYVKKKLLNLNTSYNQNFNLIKIKLRNFQIRKK